METVAWHSDIQSRLIKPTNYLHIKLALHNSPKGPEPVTCLLQMLYIFRSDTKGVDSLLSWLLIKLVVIVAVARCPTLIIIALVILKWVVNFHGRGLWGLLGNVLGDFRLELKVWYLNIFNS